MALTTAAKTEAGNGLGPVTQIISATLADQAALDAFEKAITVLGHTIAGIEGTADGVDTMHFAIQGGPLPIAAGSYAGETVAEVTIFQD